jgi:hypothetical protein
VKSVPAVAPVVPAEHAVAHDDAFRAKKKTQSPELRLMAALIVTVRFSRKTNVHAFLETTFHLVSIQFFFVSRGPD